MLLGLRKFSVLPTLSYPNMKLSNRLLHQNSQQFRFTHLILTINLYPLQPLKYQSYKLFILTTIHTYVITQLQTLQAIGGI